MKKDRIRGWIAALGSAVLPVVPAAAILVAGAAYGAQIDYKELYRKAAPGVVFIYGSDGRVAASGTGSIIETSGIVLTNNHVVTNEGRFWKSLFVFLKPEKVTGDRKKDLKNGLSAKVIASHPEFDLALLQILNPPANLVTLPLSDLSGVGIGEPTVAIGHPGGGAPWTLTTGQIGASWENYRGVQGRHIFQTNTDINPGNSGGPLLDGSGAIVGINTFIVRRGRGGLALTGLNFAVKANTAYTWIQSVQGRLPSGASIRTAKSKPPPPSRQELAQVTTPKPKPEPKKKRTPFVAKTSGDSGGRRLSLAPSRRRPREGFSTKARPGESYGGDKDLNGFFKRMRAAFDEMDADLKNAKW